MPIISNSVHQYVSRHLSMPWQLAVLNLISLSSWLSLHMSPLSLFPYIGTVVTLAYIFVCMFHFSLLITQSKNDYFFMFMISWLSLLAPYKTKITYHNHVLQEHTKRLYRKQPYLATHSAHKLTHVVRVWYIRITKLTQGVVCIHRT